MQPTARPAANPRALIVRIVLYVVLLALAMLAMASGVEPWIAIAALAAVALVFELIVAPKLFGRRAGVQQAPDNYQVTCTDEAIAAVYGDQRESVRWDEIIIVAIRIDGEAPAQQWWMVSGTKGKCWFPNDSLGLETARQQMAARLTGFDLAACTQMLSSSCGVVVAWDKAKHPLRATAQA